MKFCDFVWNKIPKFLNRNMKNNKYYLKCKDCGLIIHSFADWFKQGQICPDCGTVRADVHYYADIEDLIKTIKSKDFQPTSLWGYFDFLPLFDKKNIISVGGEGTVPIERWNFMEKFARETFNIDCKVYVQRNDQNKLTGTFKDLAGTVVSSVLTENNVKNYVVASTGNIGVAYSRYCSLAGIELSAFIPDISIKLQEAEMGCFGQRVFRVKGDYARAKALAKEFSSKHNFLLSAGNFDPLRIEAKKTMAYEWLRLMPEFPTVYMQAISGGSGPIGIAKACQELKDTGLFDKMPRFILPQPHLCAPMAAAWNEAKTNNFPSGWQYKYPIYENPQTSIQTLSTGNPNAYPPLAEIVKQSNGEITAVDENKVADAARYVAYKAKVSAGPAASVTIAGFFKALFDKQILNNDIVMLNLGEGTRRAPDFVEKITYNTKVVADVKECSFTDHKAINENLTKAVAEW